jgi:hypothetical protein
VRSLKHDVASGGAHHQWRVPPQLLLHGMSSHAIASRSPVQVHVVLLELHVESAGHVAEPFGHVTAVDRDSHRRLVQRLMFEIVRQPIDGGVHTFCPSSRGKQTVFCGQIVELALQSTRQWPRLSAELHTRPAAHPVVVHGISQAPMSSVMLVLVHSTPAPAVAQFVGSLPVVQIASSTASWH